MPNNSMRKRGAATFSAASFSIVVNFIETIGERLRTSRRTVAVSSAGSPTVRATTLRVPEGCCW